MGLGGGERVDDRSRARRGRRLAAVVPLLGLAGALVAWPVVSNATRDQVWVLSDARSLACRSGPVTLEPARTVAGVDLAMPTVADTPDLDCTYTFSIVNRGRRVARIQQLELEALGPLSRTGVEAIDLDGVRPSRRSEVDAIFDVGRALPAHAAQTFTVRLRQNPDGCNPPGARVFFPRAPAVTVRALGLGEVITPLGPTFGASGHESLICGPDD